MLVENCGNKKSERMRRVFKGGLVTAHKELESLTKQLVELEKERERNIKEEQIQDMVKKLHTLSKTKG